MYDQYLIKRNEEPMFYFKTADILKLNEQERQTVNNNRKQFGLRALEENELNGYTKIKAKKD